MAQVKALIGNIKGKDGIANIYNTSETVIGTWNGSMLYRKMIKITIPATNAIGTKVSSSYVSGMSYSKIKNVYILGLTKDQAAWSQLGVDNASNDAITVYANGSNIIVENSNSYYNNVAGYAVIEYIK